MTAEQHGSERLSQSEAERLREILQSQENTTAGFVAGVLAAVIGAVAWAILVVVTELQIGIVAIGIGALVGFAVARFGKGIDKSFGIMAGVLALLGVAFGNVLGVAAFAADGLIEYSFAESRFHPRYPGFRGVPSIHFRHNGRANVGWCDGHVDARPMTFTDWNHLYRTDPARYGIGWFGAADDNRLFDLK